MSSKHTKKKERDTQTCGIAFIGNPGVGKSTILNGLMGESAFKSGVSIGAGMTKVLQREDRGPISYFDTPGLADAERRKKAGKELDRLLAEGLPLKIVFVVTLMDGRVRPEDISTIKLVLNAIKSEDVNGNFGIIINKLSSPVLKALRNNDDEVRVRKMLTGDRWTIHWCYVSSDNKLDGKANKELLSNELLGFIYTLPVTKRKDASVRPIHTDKPHREFKKATDLIKKVEHVDAKAMKEMREKTMREKYEKYALEKLVEAKMKSKYKDIIKGHLHAEKLLEVKLEAERFKKKAALEAKEDTQRVMSVLESQVGYLQKDNDKGGRRGWRAFKQAVSESETRSTMDRIGSWIAQTAGTAAGAALGCNVC